MSWETPETKPAESADYEDRERLRMEIGLELEGTVVRVSDRKPSSFGGEVRYVDIDTTDGRKVSVSFSGWKLEDRFEPIGYQAGDGIRIRVVGKPTKDGKKTFGNPEFQINRKGAQAAPVTPPAKPLTDEPPF